MEKYNVLVIGAGPGGCKAAIECLKKNLSVILVEKKKIPGVPVHCGECISHFAFENTGIEPLDKFISRKVKGVRVSFPGENSAFLGEAGYVLNKEIFEQWLFKEAEKLGAEIMLGIEITEINHDGLFRVKAGDKLIKAGFLIDASGVSSVASRLLNINSPLNVQQDFSMKLKKRMAKIVIS